MIGMIADLPVFEPPLITFSAPVRKVTTRGSAAVARGHNTTLLIWQYIRTSP